MKFRMLLLFMSIIGISLIFVAPNVSAEAPILDPIGNQVTDELVELSFTATATNADTLPQSLSFSLQNEPSGAAINTISGLFTWTPTESQNGFHTFNVTVSDLFTAPILNEDGNTFGFGGVVKAAGNKVFINTYSIPANSPIKDIQIHTLGDQQNERLRPVAYDSSNNLLKVGPEFTIPDAGIDIERVVPFDVNDMPIVPPDGIIKMGIHVHYADNISFEGNSGTSPVPRDTGSYPNAINPFVTETAVSIGLHMRVHYLDKSGTLSDSEEITVTVNEVNTTPTLDPIGNQVTDELVELSFTATATDSDIPSQSLSFALQNAPPGAVINPTSGEFTWIPSESQDGLHTFNVTVSDGVATDSEKLTVTVNDVNVSPDCSNSSASKDSLWPPNHKMKDITIEGITDPDGDTVIITVTGITQDESINGQGDSNTSSDGNGIGSDTAQVRAERSGTGDGRVYAISFTANDNNGGMCSGLVQVSVPHDKKDTAIDSGQIYDSTQQ